LAHWLESALSIEVQVADIRRGGPHVRIDKALVEDDTNRFVAAYGLSLRDPSLVPAHVPVVNMFAYEQIRVGVREDGQRKLRISMGASCALLVCGLLTAVLGTVRAHQAAGLLAQSKLKLVATQQAEQAKSNEVALRQKQLGLLEAAGVPVRYLIQSIVRSIPKDVGLAEVKMDPQSEELSGETVNEAAMIHMSDALRSDPAFSAVSLEWFERINPAVPAAGMRFRMTMSSPPLTPSLAPPVPATVAAPATLAAPATTAPSAASTGHAATALRHSSAPVAANIKPTAGGKS
jgi:Tfp pilus assembly protein PilN